MSFAAVLDINPAAVAERLDRAFRDTEQKRRTTRYRHLRPMPAGAVDEVGC
jgi:hypothetical protein